LEVNEEAFSCNLPDMTEEKAKERFGKICFRHKYGVVRSKVIEGKIEIVAHMYSQGVEYFPRQYVQGTDNLSYPLMVFEDTATIKYKPYSL
jgi:hypothetical protein